MPSENHKECYGRMFPQTLHASNDKPLRGKVFGYELVSAGGVIRSNRRASADVPAWDECIECPEFDHCYKFSLGKFLLEAAIGEL